MKTEDKTTKNGKIMGRPKIEIKAEQFEYLCSIMCTEEDIAGVFQCSVDTICNWCKEHYGLTFSEVYKNFSAQGRMSLRRFQFRMAEKNPTMAIWLGKQYLGQTDKQEVVLNREVDDSIREMDNYFNDRMREQNDGK